MKVKWAIFLFVLVIGINNAVSRPTYSKAKTGFGMLSHFLFTFPSDVEVSATGGGVDCAGCTMVVGIVEQLTQVYNQSVDETMDMLCSFLPSVMQVPCQDLILEYGPEIIVLIDDGETPDAICNQIELCTDSTCRLYPPASAKSWQMPLRISVKTPPEWKKKIQEARESNNKRWSPWDWIVDEVNHVFNTHEPLFDIDDDNFSVYFGLRGSYWRGKDCNDENADIYPGRKINTLYSSEDHNCNGIYGTAPNGTSWEQLYCTDTPAYGVALLGDSAGAHFHIPPTYITAVDINDTTYQSLIDIIEMEGDWPEMSATTGFLASTNWTGQPEGPVDSIYLKLLNQNRCGHRDFQSIAVNGARSSSMGNIMKSYSRNQTHDNPSLTAIALLGNDVCNGHPDMGSMTTPQEFYKNIINILDYLDTILPLNSHVSMMGLIDGRILYDTMAERIHPIGSLRNDVTYSQFYDFLNCLQISPCWGWMNSNVTVRNETTGRAFELNDVYKAIVSNTTYKHFDMTYFDCPMQEVVDMWHQMGGQTYQLIEPVDGFHPTQISNYLTTKYQWELYQKKFPYLVPPVNPYNSLIQQRFGDQGGY